MKCGSLKDRTGVQPAVEEHDQGRSPVVADRHKLSPSSRVLQLECG